MRRTYYEDLGVPASAGRKAIEMAFWRWQGRSSPSGLSTEERRRAEEAYLTLADPKRRRDYDRLLGLGSHPAWTPASSRRAAAFSARAAAMATSGRNRRAVALLRRAVALDPGSAACRSFSASLWPGPAEVSAKRRGTAAGPMKNHRAKRRSSSTMR